MNQPVKTVVNILLTFLRELVTLPEAQGRGRCDTTLCSLFLRNCVDDGNTEKGFGRTNKREAYNIILYAILKNTVVTFSRFRLSQWQDACVAWTSQWQQLSKPHTVDISTFAPSCLGQTVLDACTEPTEPITVLSVLNLFYYLRF